MAAKVKDQKIAKRWAAYNGDCCEVLPDLPDESVGFSVFSPPFSDLYSYTDENQDLGNCRNYDEFFTHFEFVVKELFRVLMPGRIIAVHCMDLPMQKNKGEEIGLNDFPGDLVKLFKGKGFTFHSRHCIWKDPLVSAVRTKALGLAHKQIVKDSAMCRMGIQDQILAFRKPGENPEPIAHPIGLSEYVGAKEVPSHLRRFAGSGDARNNKLSHWIWQRYASPFWDDIRQTKVLPFKPGRDPDDERHICPLQLDVIERCLVLWSNPNDVVLTPFMGVGSEVYIAVKLGRRGIGIELKKSYYRQALRNLSSLKVKQGRGLK